MKWQVSTQDSSNFFQLLDIACDEGNLRLCCGRHGYAVIEAHGSLGGASHISYQSRNRSEAMMHHNDTVDYAMKMVDRNEEGELCVPCPSCNSRSESCDNSS